MKNPKLCPYCLNGEMRGIHGRKSGDMHNRRLECKNCKRRITVVMSREDITPRPKKIPIDQLEDYRA